VCAFLRCGNCPYNEVGLNSSFDGSGENLIRFLGPTSGLVSKSSLEWLGWFDLKVQGRD